MKTNLLTLAIALAPFSSVFGQDRLTTVVNIPVEVSVGEEFQYSLRQHFSIVGMETACVVSLGGLPKGLTLGRRNCLLSGIPEMEGAQSFQVDILEQDAPGLALQRANATFILFVTPAQPEIITFSVYRFKDGWFREWGGLRTGARYIAQSVAGKFTASLPDEDKFCTATEISGVQVLVNSIPQGICAVLGRTIVFKAGSEIQPGTDVRMVVVNAREGKKSNTIRLRAPGPDE